MHKEYRLPEVILPKLTLTLPTPDFRCFDVEGLEGQPCGELPWSSCASVYVDEAPEVRSPSVYSSHSYGTMDPVAGKASLHRNISDLPRNHTRLVGRPASLVAQDYSENVHLPCSIARTRAVDDSAPRRLGSELSRLAQSVLRRIKLLSWTGTPKKRHESTSKNGKALWSLRRITRVFSIHNDQLPRFTDTALGSFAEEGLKEKQAPCTRGLS